MQLSNHAEKFAELGINLAAISYDKQKDLVRFHQKYRITFPLLRDRNSQVIKAIGILNHDLKLADRGYGVPHPGIFILDSDGNIRAKFAEASYQDRPVLADVLAFAKTLAEQKQSVQ